MADLRPRREPRFLHLSRAEEGQGAAHGRDPARGRRLLAVSRQLSGAGAEAAARQPRPPHPRRSVPGEQLPVTFGLLLNLVGVMGGEATRDQVWGYLATSLPDASAPAYPAPDRDRKN